MARGAMTVARVERQLRRGPAMAAVEEMAIMPLPNPNRHVFLQWRACKATATLGWKWRSCGGLALRVVEAKEKQME